MDEFDILKELSLEEKAMLTVGKDFWHFESIDRLGLDSVLVTDGPHGVRKQKEIGKEMGSSESVKATCFPPACLSASSWNPELIEEEGNAIAQEALSESVDVILGPGANIKRSPLCGRNFEYFSEDPLLASSAASALINGIQKNGVGTSLKHFALNNQEKMRFVSNSVVDLRAMNEIYLKQFELAVKNSQPATIMCSYNMINGEYSSDNKWLLNDKLRDEWGFKGLVVTDWGAMNDRGKGIKAGLDVEMPGPNKDNVLKVIRAVQSGTLKEEDLDKVCLRIIRLALNAKKNRKNTTYDIKEHHEIARKIAVGSMVLLKNEDSLLPLDKNKNYSVIGPFAKKPRYQGSGSSQINSHYVDSPYDELLKKGYSVTYSENVEDARGKDAVIVFIGLTEEIEGEGFDRKDLNLPESHNRLVEEALKVNENVVVVIYAGSAFLMPWKDKVKSILLAYLPGEAAGEATADILAGDVNPSGKLAETFPLSLEDTPCYLNFATDRKNVLYEESILVGYRYYDYFNKDVLFPFGTGLSYTKFEYSEMHVNEIGENQFKVCVKVKNIGSADGAEVVQIYVEMPESKIFRAKRELRGFKKVFIKKGEEVEVEIILTPDSFSYYSVPLKRFDIEDGNYRIYASSSSRDHRLYSDVHVKGNKDPQVMPWHPGDDFSLLFENNSLPLIEEDEKLSMNSTLRDVLEDEEAKEIFKPLIDKYTAPFKDRNDGMSRMMMAMALDMPLRAVAIMVGESQAEVEKTINALTIK